MKRRRMYDTSLSALDLLSSVLLERFETPDSMTPAPVALVLGAGASLESGLPLWNAQKLKEDLIGELGRAFGSANWFVNEACRQLPQPISFQGKPQELIERLARHATMDQLCGVASLLYQSRDKLVDFLVKTYGSAATNVAPPQLAYELIAHFVKHRFVDHIISLNFDELADVALSDELGGDGFTVVLPGSLEGAGSRDTPHLFKLHGTISNADSLKFEIVDTGTLSPQMSERIDGVLFGPPKDNRCAWIVSLGYGWNDYDMRAWFERNHHRILGIIVIALDDKPAELLRDTLVKRDKKFSDKGLAQLKIHSVATEGIVAGRIGVHGKERPTGGRSTVDEVLWAVWSSIRSARAREESREFARSIPSAARHLVLSHLFPAPASSRRRWPGVFADHNTRNRFHAEVLLTAGKTDGFVTLSSIGRDPRIMRHADTGPRSETHLDSLPFLRRSREADVTEVYFYNGTSSEYADHFQSCAREEPITIPRLQGGKIIREDACYDQFLNYYLGKVFAGVSIEVDPGIDSRAQLLFRQAVPLRTLKAMTDATQRLLLNSKWSTLCVIAESGRWLTGKVAKKAINDRQVLLIEASRFGLADWVSWEDVNLDPLQVASIGMPWFLHNRHLTLAVDKKGRPVGGIYFRRRERTPRISPVLLPGPTSRASREERKARIADLGELAKIFFAYSARYLEEYAASESNAGTASYNSLEFYDRLLASKLRASLPSGGSTWVKRIKNARPQDLR